MNQIKSISRRDFMKYAQTGAVAFGLGPYMNKIHAQTKRKPNILIIAADQARADILGCAGDSLVSTPNLDQIAKEGVRFTHCVSSNPICSPFRASFITGQYSFNVGVTTNNMPCVPNHKTMGEMLSEAGYKTGFIGKWHLAGTGGSFGYVPPEKRMGWDFWIGFETGHKYYPTVWRATPDGREAVPGYNWEPTWFTDNAISFIKDNKDNPFALYVFYNPPHGPSEAPPKYADLYDGSEFELDPAQKKNVPDEKIPVLRNELKYYYAQMKAVDDEVGRLMKELKNQGIDDNTIILYTSDHGDYLGSHYDRTSWCSTPPCPVLTGIRGKATPFATAFRTPLLIRYPDRVAGNRVCDALVSTVDLLPTLLELAGLDVPSFLEGDSMAGWCLDGMGRRNEFVYLACGLANWRGVWDGRYIYSPFGTNSNRRVLFDHREDPYELNDLISSTDPHYVNVMRRLKEYVVAAAERFNDPDLNGIRNAGYPIAPKNLRAVVQ